MALGDAEVGLLRLATAEEDVGLDEREALLGTSCAPSSSRARRWWAVAASALLGSAGVLAIAAGCAGSTASSASARSDAAIGYVTVEAPAVSCHTTVKGEECYEHVRWAMTVGIKEHPAWYPGLTEDGAFVEFQDRARWNPENKCPRPCPEQRCATARPGSRCHMHVQWVIVHGFQEHPEWYPTLKEDSTREEVQDALHAANTTVCPTRACALGGRLPLPAPNLCP